MLLKGESFQELEVKDVELLYSSMCWNPVMPGTVLGTGDASGEGRQDSYLK